MFKVNESSICSSCNQKVSDTQGLTCMECDCFFHGVCPSAADKDTQLCNATFLASFLKPSVKPNFTWTCDICKTESETNKVATLRQQIKSISTVHTAQINTLINLVTDLTVKVDKISETKAKPDEIATTVWGDKNKVQKMKSALVIKPDGHGKKVNANVVRKFAANEGIPVDSVIEAVNGEMFVNLPDEESRDRVGQFLEETHSSNPIVKLMSKLPTIAVMGVTSRDVKNDEDEDLTPAQLEQSIYKQNRSIAHLIDNGSQLKVVFVRPPPPRKLFYTVVIRVSPDIRTVIKDMKNKIYMGVSVHNIVDRFHVKRCNRCQGFGHYEDKCPPTNHLVCGFCAKDHKSDDCPAKTKNHEYHKCINCSGDGHNASGHPAFWTKCPAYITAQRKSMKTIAFDYSDLDLN